MTISHRRGGACSSRFLCKCYFTWVREGEPLPYNEKRYLLVGATTRRPLLDKMGRRGSTAVRSRSRSDNTLCCHSLRSRRFATSPPTNYGGFSIRRGDHWSSSDKKRTVEDACPYKYIYHRPYNALYYHAVGEGLAPPAFA